MGMLSLREATEFEDHYITCARCAAIAEAADLYVGAMREAARTVRGFDRGEPKVGAATD